MDKCLLSVGGTLAWSTPEVTGGISPLDRRGQGGQRSLALDLPAVEMGLAGGAHPWERRGQVQRMPGLQMTQLRGHPGSPWVRHQSLWGTSDSPASG